MSLFKEFQKLPKFSSLTQDQKDFSEKFFHGGFFHLTGAAGTGKSFIINTLFDFMKSKGKPFVKTASTGVSAFNIGGQTIHSFFGIGLGEEDVGYLIGKIKKNKKVADRIKSMDRLLIDEVSMVKGSILDKIDIILKYFKADSRPFGGLSLVIASGDFLQLSAIWKNEEVKEYAFNCRAWTEAGFKNVELIENVRQGKSNEFSELLNKIRVGDSSGIEILGKRFGAKFPDDGIKPVVLYCTNKDVTEYNNECLAKLKTQERNYKAKFMGRDYYKESFIKNCPSPEFLKLKIGASVMITSNLDTARGIVNGTMGVVEAFSSDGPVIKTSVGTVTVTENTWEIKEQELDHNKIMKYTVVASWIQIPLRIAFACTVHRVQGLTIDRAVLDLERTFSAGQIYVALSRVRDLESLSISNLPINKITANKECLEFYNYAT